MHVVVLGMRGIIRPVAEYLAPLARRGARITYVVRGAPTPYLLQACHTVLDMEELGGPDALVEAVAALHDLHPVTAVAGFCEEFMVPAARIAERLELPMSSVDSAIRCTDKARMRHAMAAAGVPVPTFHHVRTRAEFDAAVAAIGFPCVVKPVRSSGSRGVKVVRSAAAAAACFEWSRRVSVADGGRDDLLAEAFVGGPEYSAEIIVAEGRVAFAACTEKFLIGGDYCDEVGHVHPFHFPPDMSTRISEVIQATVTAVGVRRGGCHMEFKVNGEEVTVIEIAARPGGAGIPGLMKMSTGADYLDMLYAALLGEPVSPRRLRQGWAGVRFVTATEPSVVRADRFSPAVLGLAGVVQAGIFVPRAAVLQPESSGGRRVAFITARHRDRAALLRLLDAAHEVGRKEVLAPLAAPERSAA